MLLKKLKVVLRSLLYNVRVIKLEVKNYKCYLITFENGKYGAVLDDVSALIYRDLRRRNRSIGPACVGKCELL